MRCAGVRLRKINGQDMSRERNIEKVSMGGGGDGKVGGDMAGTKGGLN